LRNHNAVNKSNTPDLLAAYAESAKMHPIMRCAISSVQ